MGAAFFSAAPIPRPSPRNGNAEEAPCGITCPGADLGSSSRLTAFRYSFTASTPAAGALRPLREPDASELDEDDEGVG